MRVYHSIIVFAVAAGLVTLAAQPLVASQHIIPQYFDYTLEPVTLPEKSGPVDLLFTFKMKPEYECDSVLVQAAPWKELVYDGPAEFWASLAETGEYSTTLSVTVPPNDTSAIFLTLKCPGRGQLLTKAFITTADAIEVLDYIPTPIGPEPPRPQRRINRSRIDPDNPPKVIDTDKRVEPFVEPTEEEIRQRRRESQMREMRELEKQPLTSQGSQQIVIDGTYYIRYRGETKFHVAQPVTDTWAYAQRLTDSLRALPPDTEYDVVLHLSEPKQLELARKLTDSLVLSNRPDFYLTRTTKAVLKQLDAIGVDVGYLNQLPHNMFLPASDTSGPDGDEASDSVPAPDQEMMPGDLETLLFLEDFESPYWPGIWQVEDVISASGADYWGRVSCQKRYGTYSCWCNGTGSRAACTSYDDWIGANMWTTQPIDISGYDSVNVTYYHWYDLGVYEQAGYAILYSFDGVAWTAIEQFWSGSSYNWQQSELGIPANGESSLYLKFLFYHAAEGFNEEGIYVDHISVNGYYPPNLSVYAPSGWDYPLVLSSVPGTHTVNTLYSGETVYIDWCAKNTGAGPCGAFQVSLIDVISPTYIVEIDSWQCDPLDPGDSIVMQDLQYVLYGSFKDLVLSVDPTYQVYETSEDDNKFRKLFYLESASITFSGYTKYWDMNPEADSTLPIRNAVIEMLDDEGASNPELVAMTTTDDYGYFSFPTVDNYDDPQDISDRRDIFFRINSENEAAQSQLLNQTPYWESDVATDLPSGV